MRQTAEPRLCHAVHVPSSPAPSLTGSTATAAPTTAAATATADVVAPVQHTATAAHTRSGRPQRPRGGRMEEHTRGKCSVRRNSCSVQLLLCVQVDYLNNILLYSLAQLGVTWVLSGLTHPKLK